MRVVQQVSELERKPRAVALGTFDGVHRGHRAVLAEVLSAGLTPTVVTFDPHPRIAFGNQVELITTLERRIELIGEAGIEETLVVRFDLELARLEPEEFAEQILRAIGAEVVVTGADFRFGRGRRGDLALLRALGFDTHVAAEVEGVSSTEIRRRRVPVSGWQSRPIRIFADPLVSVYGGRPGYTCMISKRPEPSGTLTSSNTGISFGSVRS